MSGFAVALTEADAQPGPAARFLAGRPGFSLREAREHLRRNPGFLGRALTLEAADALRAAAADVGLPCALFPEDALLPPPSPLKPNVLRPGPAGLEVLAGASPFFMDYTDVAVLSASGWDAPPTPSGPTALMPDLFRRLLEAAGANRLPLSSRSPLETYFRADLVTASGLRLLLDPDALDFSELPEKSPSAAVNFRKLLQTLSSRAPRARRNLFLSAFLEGRDLTQLKVSCPGAADLDVVRLLLTAPRPL